MEAQMYKRGDVLDYTNSSGSTKLAGEVVQVGGRAAFLVADVANGDTVGAQVLGVAKVAMAAVTITEGQKMYWDENGDPVGGTAGTGAATNVHASGDFALGASIFAEADTETHCYVLMNYFAGAGIDLADLADVGDGEHGSGKILVADGTDFHGVAVSGDATLASTGALTIAAGAVDEAMLAADATGTQRVIADPVDGGAIPVTASGHVPLVTEGGAETRTLADATYEGQQLSLGFKADAGDCVITAASPVNQAGNNTLTFADVGDHLLLVAVDDSGDLEWRIVCNDGVALSTV